MTTSAQTLTPYAPADSAIEVLDSRWDHARALMQEGKRTAEEFASEIERLRKLYLIDKTSNLKRGNSPTSQRGTSETDLGLQAAISRELGISKNTAYRILDRARYTRMLASAAAGEEVKYLTGTGNKKREACFLPSEDAMVKARELLDDVVAGDVKASAAWAGVVGETRRVAKTGKKERSATNHFGNIRGALIALANSLEHWSALSTEERAILEGGWAQLAASGLIPSTWTR